MTEPKNCPFCGSETIPIWVHENFDFKGKEHRNFYAVCSNCKARTGEYPSEEKAIEAWNRRHSENNFSEK